MTESFASDFYSCPSFFITHAVCEVAGFNIRIYHWERRGSILAPQFIAIVPTADLAAISRDVQATATRSLAENIMPKFAGVH